MTPDVGKLQQDLVEAGERVEVSELASSTLGPSTVEAVRSFQRKHRDAVGRPLAVDGLVGPSTLWALAHQGASGLGGAPEGWRRDPAGEAEPVVAAAIADVGRREDPDGSNDGPDLRKFRTGGSPWCALAASTWWAEAGSPFGRLAAVWAIHDWALKNGRIVPSDAPVRPGDLFLILRAGGHGHVGLVVGVEGDRLSCVEGNSGNAVRQRIRYRADVQDVVRPKGAVT